MLRVVIELRHAVTGGVSTLGVLHITNDGKRGIESDHKVGDYNVRLYDGPDESAKPNAVARVKDFKRLENGPWKLVYLALKQIYGKK